MSLPVFSESLSSAADYHQASLTQPFSQILCISDSDETLSQNTSHRTRSPSPVLEQHSEGLVDLTTLSNSLDETVSSKRSEYVETSENTPCSPIVLSDSANSSSAQLNCSTMNSSANRLSSGARARLNDFFDNIPSSTQNISKPEFQLTESQLSDNMFEHTPDEGSKEESIVETQTSDKTSPVMNEKSEPKEDHSPVLRNLKISAKIKIKVHVSELSDESSSESEKPTEKTDQSKANQGIQRSEQIIDNDMMDILTEIYGNAWRTPKNVALCQPRPKKGPVQPKDHISTIPGKVSFLQSLDEKTPLDLCSTELRKYRTHFNTTKDKLMAQLYELYNREVFEDKMNVPLSWNKKLTCTAGRCFNIKKNGERSCKIELSDKVITCAERMRSTLIHEMCHAAAWIFHAENGHGKHWKHWTYRARRALPELPPITVCHQYEIEYKYTYQCVLCKSKYNAHTRSKKTENIRCAYCHGKIELFVNKKNKDGETVATPAKAGKGFAAFVKDKYKHVRQGESNHADTMKVLSQKFAGLSTEQKNLYA
ncbi:germ cell nuclear acidic protein-like [Armigeres subalbatus]|uniref:germ cell nuclear acidic protein-like n=1 Tax=Armigeres subalbatus TaxID=124917 RepID=UPI002ED0E6A3